MTVRCILVSAATSAGCLLAGPGVGAEPTPEEIAFFESKIRPVLVEHCLACHGDDPEQIEADLNLSHRLGVLRGGKSGQAVAPGHPAESLLIAALRYESKSLEMPPDEQLPEAVIADFVRWVEMGVPDPREPSEADERSTPGAGEIREAARNHWAYQPIANPEPPEIDQPERAANAIDQFLLAKLDEKGLTPTARADRLTLIRRVTFDLTGLPPTPREIDTFVDDSRSDAYRRLVERLLESTHYGERWGRHWLDVARYADSNGLDEHLAYPAAYRYRDYVIQSFNADKPYDQFLTEQLAGDLLPAASEHQRYQNLIATGFLVIGPKVLAEPDEQKMELDIIDEQIDTLGKAFLGHSLGCARCHDHKFDPVSAEDYYALAGVLGSTRTMQHHKRVARWHERPLAAESAVAAWEEHVERMEEAEAEIEAFVDRTNRALQSAWIDGMAEFLLASEFDSFDDGAGLPAEIVDRWRRFLASDAAAASPFHLWNSLSDAASDDGRLDPEAWQSTLQDLRRTDSALELQMIAHLASPAPRTLEALGTRFAELVALPENPGPGHDAPTPGASTALETDGDEEKLGDEDDDSLLGHGSSVAARIRREVLEPLLKEGGPLYLTPLDDVDDDEEGGEVDLAFYSQAQRDQFEQFKRRFERLKSEGPPTPDYAMAVAERDEAVDLPVHYRGSYQNLADQPVPRGVPGEIGGNAPMPSISSDESGRLQLARWMTDPAHPLTARVMANRIWQWHFGVGLAASPSNFGLTSDPPSHPELLDYLASEFVRSGWSVKALHRQIVLSAAYQRSSTYDAAATEVDPENRLLWRFSRRRLDAHQLRDALLAVSGELDLSLGGTLFTSNRYAYVDRDAIRSTYSAPRRAIYLPVIRTAMYPLFTTFDYFDSHASLARRPQSTVVQQALFLLNDPFVLDRARAFAMRLLLDDQRNEAERIEQAYLLAFGRPPTEQEIAASTEDLRESLVHYRDLLQSEDGRWRATIKAWADLCHALLASNEFLHVN